MTPVEKDETRRDESEKGYSMWLVISLILGIIVGFVVPSDHEDSTNIHLPNHCKANKIEHVSGRLSLCLGWISFVCWGISFYPQLYLNYKLKHTNGLSSFYQLMNIAGYAAYSLYNGFFYFSTSVQTSFCLDNNGSMNVVRLSDVFFSFHAFIITWITVFQIYYYNNDVQTGALAILIFASISVLTFIFGGTNINYLYGLGTFKVIVTLIKYMPQVYLNYSRSSTSGWTIHNVLLDFTGGITSTIQLFIDAKNFQEVVADFPKLCLGSISMFFDVIFLIQHYVLYNDDGVDDDDNINRLLVDVDTEDLKNSNESLKENEHTKLLVNDNNVDAVRSYH